MLGGEARDRFAGFWRAFGLVPPPEPDHLGTLLGLYASLVEAEEGAADALLHEHLLSWLLPWLDVVEAGGHGPYPVWAGLLRRVLVAEAVRTPWAGPLPLHLRSAGPVADPRREGGGAFLAALLAPVRSGLILTRADLARCGRELGLGFRMGERRYALEALLGQEPAPVLGWLAGEAAGWARRHEVRPEGWPQAGGEALERVVGYWRDRAAETAELLEGLAVEGEGTGGAADR